MAPAEPHAWSLQMTETTGIAAAGGRLGNSMALNPKEASPETRMTFVSGRASLAAMAKGIPIPRLPNCSPFAMTPAFMLARRAIDQAERDGVAPIYDIDGIVPRYLSQLMHEPEGMDGIGGGLHLLPVALAQGGLDAREGVEPSAALSFLYPAVKLPEHRAGISDQGDVGDPVSVHLDGIDIHPYHPGVGRIVPVAEDPVEPDADGQYHICHGQGGE